MTQPTTNTTNRHALLALALALTGLLGGCASAGDVHTAAAAPPKPCIDPQSVTSIPGSVWWKEQRWRYASDADATTAYQKLEQTTPPWPDWFTPQDSILPVGTRFQMALAPGQPETKPGGFGTFDAIEDSRDVRDYLAVLYAWKPVVDRVVTYETTQPMKVQIGPIGPQVDPTLCRLLPGRWSQVSMQVPAADRMTYLKVIAIRQIR
ncbi:hypothetical protein GCM10009087_07370 [Sphingomonas oligophenolica]|uniref:Lipoprotein n=1 Tax=Sphingomonas oligophenolica TaxID=301154 RepID=A0ABU9XXG8_9SPHN